MKVLKDYEKNHKKEFIRAIRNYYGSFIWFDVIAFCIAYALIFILFFAAHGGYNMEAFMYALRCSVFAPFWIVTHFCDKFSGFHICDVTVSEIIYDNFGDVAKLKDTDGRAYGVVRVSRHKFKVGKTYMVFVKGYKLTGYKIIDEFCNMPNFVPDNIFGD